MAKKKAAKKSAVRKFDDKRLDEMIAAYKAGATIAELKAKYHCYGNPLVKRLVVAGVYEPNRKPEPKAKPQAKKAA